MFEKICGACGSEDVKIVASGAIWCPECENIDGIDNVEAQETAHTDDDDMLVEEAGQWED
jgi:uncharacterized Zn finger protein (UPF0148 family)